MRSEVFRVDNYPAAAAVATGKALMAADSGSLSSVTGTDRRQRKREERKPDFWSIVSASALWQKGGGTALPERGRESESTAAERWNWALKDCLFSSALPRSFFPFPPLSSKFFHPNSSAALLNLRALEVAWASKRQRWTSQRLFKMLNA